MTRELRPEGGSLATDEEYLRPFPAPDVTPEPARRLLATATQP